MVNMPNRPVISPIHPEPELFFYVCFEMFWGTSQEDVAAEKFTEHFLEQNSGYDPLPELRPMLALQLVDSWPFYRRGISARRSTEGNPQPAPAHRAAHSAHQKSRTPHFSARCRKTARAGSTSRRRLPWQARLGQQKPSYT